MSNLYHQYDKTVWIAEQPIEVIVVEKPRPWWQRHYQLIMLVAMMVEIALLVVIVIQGF